MEPAPTIDDEMNSDEPVRAGVGVSLPSNARRGPAKPQERIFRRAEDALEEAERQAKLAGEPGGASSLSCCSSGRWG